MTHIKSKDSPITGDNQVIKLNSYDNMNFIVAKNQFIIAKFLSNTNTNINNLILIGMSLYEILIGQGKQIYENESEI